MFQADYQFLPSAGGESSSGVVAQLPWLWRIFPAQDGRTGGEGTVVQTSDYRPLFTYRPRSGGHQLFYSNTVEYHSTPNYAVQPTNWPNAIGDKNGALLVGYRTGIIAEASGELSHGQIYATPSATDGITIVVACVPFLVQSDLISNARVFSVFGANGGLIEVHAHRDHSLLLVRNESGSVGIVDEITWSDPGEPELFLGVYQIGLGTQGQHTVIGRGDQSTPAGPNEIDDTQFTYEPRREGGGGPPVIGMQAKTFNENERAFPGYILECGIIPRLLTSEEETTLKNYLQNYWSGDIDTSPWGVRADLCRDALDPRCVSCIQYEDSALISDGDITGDLNPRSKYHDPSRGLITPLTYNNNPVFRESGLNGGHSIELSTATDAGYHNYSNNGDSYPSDGVGFDQLGFTGNGITVTSLCNPADVSGTSVNHALAWIFNYRGDGTSGWGFDDQFGLGVGFDGTDTYVRFMTPSANRGGADSLHTETGYSGIVLVSVKVDFNTGEQKIFFNRSEVLSNSITLTKLESGASSSQSDSSVEIGQSELRWFRQSTDGGAYTERKFAGQLGPTYIMDGLMDHTRLEDKLIESYGLSF